MPLLSARAQAKAAGYLNQVAGFGPLETDPNGETRPRRRECDPTERPTEADAAEATAEPAGGEMGLDELEARTLEALKARWLADEL